MMMLALVGAVALPQAAWRLWHPQPRLVLATLLVHARALVNGRAASRGLTMLHLMALRLIYIVGTLGPRGCHRTTWLCVMRGASGSKHPMELLRRHPPYQFLFLAVRFAPISPCHRPCLRGRRTYRVKLAATSPKS